jgi:transcriptional regulator with XRE-family HTH domain
MGGEGLSKKVAVPETRALVGRVIERAIHHARMSQKEAAYRLGVDQAHVSRWCNGSEPPSLIRILTVPALACGLSVAIAELQDGVEVRTVITIGKTERLA